MCPRVLFDQDILFLQLLNPRHHPESDLWDFVRGMYEQTQGSTVALDSWWSTMERRSSVMNSWFFPVDDFSSVSTPTIISYFARFRDICQHQLTLVTCGIGLSTNTLFWVQSSGSGVKDSSTTFEVSGSTLLTLACQSRLSSKTN